MTDETIFAAAIAIDDAAQREAYLDQACAGDPDLRQEVEQLLSAHDSDNPVDRPPAALAMTAVHDANPLHEACAKPGDRIGPYKLLERIGQGGMGEVWVADQLEPIKRRVALKLIKAGMDSKAVLARFEAERQALALMDHPNIAKVFDAGTTPDGRPFFAMELVKGTPITEFCDIRKMTPRERLELFVPVCQAIQHAHQKGIIHRDIKPSNVLVALHDETPVAKVIDFGLAKAFGQQLTEKTLYTAFGSLIGTPAYMAPEQATFNQLDIDTRADVYALGVLLYELLTGSPPVEPERLRKAALDEVLRIVRDEDPIRPSLRLSTSEARAKIAQTRQSDPSRLSALMRGELDWIVMKALEKDRTRRYETATGLGQDVARYLEGETVEACPPTLRYRFGKLVRRNRPQVAAAGLVLGALLVAIAGTTFGLIRAERALEKAERAAERERTARKQAVQQRVRAERTVADTLDVLDSVTSSDVLDAMITQQQLSDEQLRFLADVPDFYQGLAREKEQDEVIRFRTAKAAQRVARIQVILGNYRLASVAREKARIGFAELATDFPENLDYRYHLAMTMGRIGYLRMLESDWKGSDEAYCKAELEFERLIEARPEVIESRIELAHILTSHGRMLKTYLDRPTDATRMLQRAVDSLEHECSDSDTQEARGALARAYANLANFTQLDLSEREAMHRKSYAIRKQLLAEDPEDMYFQHYVARSGWSLAALHEEQGQWAEAEKWWREALATYRQHYDRFPNMPRAESAVGYTAGRLANVLEKQNRWSEAERLYREAISIKEQQVEANPNYQLRIRSLPLFYAGLARVLEATNQTHNASEVYEIKVKQARLRVKQSEYQSESNQEDVESLIELGSSTRQLAAAILGPSYFDESIAGPIVVRAEECLQLLEKADSYLKPYLEHETLGEEAAQELALSQSYRGTAHSRLGQHAKAADAFGEAITLSNEEDSDSAFRLQQAIAHAHTHPVDEVIEEVESLEAQSDQGIHLFYRALIYSVASSRSKPNGNQHAATAIALLRQAVQSKTPGAGLPGDWKNHPDLDPLRDRDDFQSLVAEQMAEDSAA